MCYSSHISPISSKFNKRHTSNKKIKQKDKYQHLYQQIPSDISRQQLTELTRCHFRCKSTATCIFDTIC